MTTSNTQTFTTETGEQALIEIPATDNITVFIESGASDDIDIEVGFKGSATRFKVEQGLSGNIAKHVQGPINFIGIDIDANVSNDIKVHFLSSNT